MTFAAWTVPGSSPRAPFPSSWRWASVCSAGERHPWPEAPGPGRCGRWRGGWRGGIHRAWELRPWAPPWAPVLSLRKLLGDPRWLSRFGVRDSLEHAAGGVSGSPLLVLELQVCRLQLSPRDRPEQGRDTCTSRADGVCLRAMSGVVLNNTCVLRRRPEHR